MPYKSDFFTAVETSPGIFDRTYDASSFSNRFEKFFTTGIIMNDVSGLTNELEVSVVTSTMKTSVNLGQAIINGYVFDLYSSAVELTHSTANPVYNRIDRVVLELNLTQEVRAIELKILEGTPSATPVAPSLTRTTDVYQLSLAQVLVVANTATLSAENVTDERNNVSVCGLSVVKTPHADEGTYAQTEGDTFSGDVILENNVMLKGKGTNGIPNNLAYVDNEDKSVLGTTVRPTQINSSIDLTALIGGNTYIMLHNGNSKSITWYDLTLQNSWVAYDTAHYKPQYAIDNAGNILLRGAIKNGTTTASTVLFNLPSGFRVAKYQAFGVSCFNGTTVQLGEIRAEPSGNAVCRYNIANGKLMLDGIVIRKETE